MRSVPLVALGLVLGLTACSTGTHVVYVHEQTLGIDLAATSEGTNKFNIGYDREAFAVVPRVDAEGDGEGDAMSLTAISRTYIQGISNIEIGHCIATGEPAVLIAKGDSGLTEVAAKIFVGSTKARKPAVDEKAKDAVGSDDAGGGQ